MKLGTIWKEAHSHFHGTCGVYPMQSVNINLVTHAFSCDIKEVLVRGYAEVDYSCITGSKEKQCCVGYGFITARLKYCYHGLSSLRFLPENLVTCV